MPLFLLEAAAVREQRERPAPRIAMLVVQQGEAGAGCMMSARPDVFEASSAEEGGGVILDRGKDGKTR